MRTIFVKLFVWFWLSTVLSGVVFFLIAFNLLGPVRDQHWHHIEAQHRQVLGQALAVYGGTAAALTEREGSPARADAESGALPGPHPYLFAADGTPISRDVPPPLASAVRARRDGHGDGPEDRDLLVLSVRGPSGREYLAAVSQRPPQAPPREPDMFHPPPPFWLQSAITFVVSGLACYILSWRLTAPVRRLRAATQGLAGGDLSSRVTASLEETGNEFNDLGRDFNLMAARIEKLLLAHKQLVRDASHELRSPLARLNVALGIARKESPPSAAKALDRIEYESERLNLLITELLTLCKLDEGSDLAKSEIDLTRLVEEVARDADFEACARDRRVRWVTAPGIVVHGSRDFLSRALENVVRNAVKYTAEGTTVEMTLEREDAVALLRVHDRGPGVPEGQLQDIFRPFYRVAQARDRESGGTGIGLAIAEKTVTLHGGSIAAQNLPGGGLEVAIRLPLIPGGGGTGRS